MRQSLHIGFVYSLREDYRALGYSEEETAEFDTEESLDAMIKALERNGNTVDRIGDGLALARRLVKGEKWDLVFPMAEGLLGRNREAHVPALLELFDQRYILSDVLTMAVALDKSVAKRLVRDFGVPTPNYMIAESGAEDFEKWKRYPAFVKPIAEGTSKGCNLDSKTLNSSDLARKARRIVDHFGQPALIEEYLPGREFTIGVVGNGDETEILGVAEITMNENADQDIFTMRNKENQDVLCTFTKATDFEALKAAELALLAYKALGCRDLCRIDFRSDGFGNPNFLEANPIAGLHPTNSDLPIIAELHGVSYDALMARIVSAAMSRYQKLPAVGS